EPDAVAQLREEHGIGAGPVVLYVSRLEPANRVDLLVEATAILAERVPDVTTVIIGNGDQERERLVALARQTGVESKTRFLSGIYNETVLARWFAAADAYCYPENIGLSLIHAFWYGMPVVTSDRFECHNPEIAALRPGENGMTYAHGDVADLARALETILRDDALRDAMSQQARRTVETEFSLARMVDGMEAAFRYANALHR
ncbi:MAG: glycosyltransferase family 4 protein, partial [Planctomycetales bacterium]|nr:glycosyltransferase family 4 protein [Planctomycetales bacterium]